MIVYQTNPQGVYLGPITADESPLEPGVFLIPAGCVQTAPPSIPDGFQAVWQSGAWALVALPAPEPEPEPPPPPTAEELRAATAPLTRRQLFIALASEGHLTEQDAEDAAAGSAIPAAIAAIFDTLGAAERRAARITFRSFTVAYRTDPMVPVILLASPNPPTAEQLDTMWTTYANV